MAMKPYSRVLYGRQRVKERDGSETILAPKVVSREILSGVQTSVGDYTTPRPHAFAKDIQLTLHGYEKNIFANGETRVISGPDLRAVNLAGLTPVGFNDSIRQSAVANLYKGLRDSDIDLSVDGVQWRQTFAMLNVWKRTLWGMATQVKHVIPTAVKTQRALDRLNRGILHRDELARRTREIDKSLDWLASRRLEYVYGWKPTCSTFYDLVKLATTPKPGVSYTIYKGKGFLPSERVIRDSLNGLPILHEIYQWEYCRIVCEFSPSDSVMTKLGQISSLNPVSLIYEATPYSFVLDWAIGLGPWLRSVESAIMYQSTFKRGYESKGYKWICKSSWKGSSTDLTYEADARSHYVRTQFKRTVLNAAPFPTRPRLQTNFGLDQALNAAALLKQKVSFLDKLLDRRK